MVDETLAVLKSIDASLKALLALSQARRATNGNGPASGPAVAPDSDLDGQYGDPIVKAKDPKDWSGETMKGLHFSECPAAYLDMVADRLDYFAMKSEETGAVTTSGQPKSKYERLDAARARGWAARIRAGKVPAPAMDGDDDLPEGWR